MSAAVEILLLALLVGFLIFRLNNVLGTRNDMDSPAKKNMSGDGMDDGWGSAQETVAKVIDLPQWRKKVLKSPDEVSLSPQDKKLLAQAGSDAEAAFLEIRRYDDKLTVATFLEGAQVAYPMILEAYCKADEDTLHQLLDKKVLARFLEAIEDREHEKETLAINLTEGTLKAHIVGVSLQEAMASIRVRYESTQAQALRDAAGNLVGDPASAEPHTVVEIWTFSRDMNAADPNWMLIQTQAA